MPGLAELENQIGREGFDVDPQLSEITPDLINAAKLAGFEMLAARDLPFLREQLSGNLHAIVRADQVMDGFLAGGEELRSHNLGGWLYFQKEDPPAKLATIIRIGYLPTSALHHSWQFAWGLQIDTLVDLEAYATLLDAESVNSLVPSQPVLHEGHARVQVIARKDLPHSNPQGRSPIYFPEGKLFYSNLLVVNEPLQSRDDRQFMEVVSQVITESVASQEEFIKNELAQRVVGQAQSDTLVMSILADIVQRPVRSGGRIWGEKPLVINSVVLKQKMREHNLSQGELAKLVGSSQSSISNAVHGKGVSFRFGANFISKLASILNVPIEELVNPVDAQKVVEQLKAVKKRQTIPQSLDETTNTQS